MSLLSILKNKWKDKLYKPFLIHPNGQLFFEDILNQSILDISQINEGDVVALIGDFDPKSIKILFELIEKKTIIVPLTVDTKKDHEYFFKSAIVDYVIENNVVYDLKNNQTNIKIDEIRRKKHSGLILFSTGTTGRPKAILHDLTIFMKRYLEERPCLRTLNFLLFDHIGGLNTLFHTLFNTGTVIAPLSRNIDHILELSKSYKVEVLPTTPTFLRMLLIGGYVPQKIPKNIKIITYGTERMDQKTLDILCESLPNIDFRQTYGMSELGILRVKSEKRNSLYMKIGGEGIETKIEKNVLFIKSQTRMVGYLNADNPFDNNGWYNTNDVVETKKEFIKIVGREGDKINVAGLKFMPSEVEKIAHDYKSIKLAKARGKNNPITGQHVELFVEVKEKENLNITEFKNYLKVNLSRHMVPNKIIIVENLINHRYKKS